MPSRITELYTQLHLLSPYQIKNKRFYYENFCGMIKGRFGYESHKDINLDILYNKMDGVMFRVKKTDVLKDLPSLLINEVFIDMSDEEMSEYDDIESGLKTMDLSKWKDPKTGKPIFPRYSDIQKNIDNASRTDSEIFKLLTEMGYFKDKKGRTALIDICEIIQQKEYDKFKFILIDEDGNETRGRVAMCNALRQFEEFVTTDIRAAIGMNVIKTYFDYSPNYDFSKKIFKVDVTDLNPKISIEEIVNRGVDKNNTLTQVKGELTFPDKIISDETGEAIPVTPKSIVGKNKYKNVYITFSVS
jgi:SNF2 family DNA or RNA helicase